MKNATNFIFFISVLIVANCVSAVEIQQGQLYQGGTKIESSELGLSFTIPQQWQGGWPAGSEYFILENQALQSNIFVYIDAISESDLKATMGTAIPLDYATVLNPISEPLKKGKTLSGDYSVSSDINLSGYIEAMTGLGENSVAFIALFPKSQAKKIKSVTHQLMGSLAYQKPKPTKSQSVGSQGGQTSGQGSWQQYLMGRHLVRLYTGSGYSEEEHIYLCSDGSFYRSNNAGGFGGGASGAFGGKGQGKWGARGSTNSKGTLVLQYGAGSVSTGSTPGFDWSETGPGGDQVTFSVEFYENKLYLNDTKWFRDSNNYCN